MAPAATAPRPDGDASKGRVPKPRIVMLYEEYIHLPMLKKVSACPVHKTLSSQACNLHCTPQTHLMVLC